MRNPLTACIAISSLALAASGADTRANSGTATLWQDPGNVESRDLIYGRGGQQHEPEGPYTFVKEDRDGNSPKFVVKDGRGVEWKVKVGSEARPETAVARLVWAVGYITDEDYFLPAARVENMPAKLSRGGEFVTGGGVVHDARWERMDRKKEGKWRWRDNPFSKTRELNGLRVLMSLFGNYDMKDSQNAVYDEGDAKEYVVSDLGATLGTTGSRWPRPSSKGDLRAYGKSDFIKKVAPDYVDFAAPSWPMLFGFLPTPPLPYDWITAPVRLFGGTPAPNVYMQRWIGKRIPREDARWIGGLLERLSPEQIRDAFRAAHYSPEEVEGFSKIIQSRIALLSEL